MRFTLTIDCDNAAFGEEDSATPCRGHEVARILRALAAKVEPEQSGDAFMSTLRDANGNTVGTAEFQD